jgi:hypothetical protein
MEAGDTGGEVAAAPFSIWRSARVFVPWGGLHVMLGGRGFRASSRLLNFGMDFLIANRPADIGDKGND